MIKNIELLSSLLAPDADAILRARADAHARFAAIDFKVLSVTPGTPAKIALRITQGPSHAGNYFDNKRLSEIGKELFAGIVDCKIITRPIPYAERPTDVVTPEWIDQKIRLHECKPKDLSVELGIDANTISAYRKGLKTLTGPVKAAFFYYFKT